VPHDQEVGDSPHRHVTSAVCAPHP
jgi:hypothetical protein